MPCPSEDQLVAFAEGTLAGPDRTDVLSHIDGCSACRSVVSLFSRSSLMTPNSPPASSPHRWVSTAITEQTSIPSAEALGPPVGSQVGRYFLLRVVGSGAMGVVYEAYDPELKREVALKVLVQKPATQEMLDEARALAALAHPNVVTVYDSGRAGALIYIVMELVGGQSLRHWLLETPDVGDVVSCFVQVAEGLAAVHHAGLVHRDVKPDNIVLGDDRRPRLLDFGFAFSDDGAGAQATHIVGTPRYMAPEVTAGQQADALSDQFSFCMAMREAFDGREAPAHIAWALAKGTQAKPSNRFASMNELLAELRRDPAAKRRTARFITAAAALVLLAVAVPAYAINRNSKVCKGGENKLQGVWDGARRAEVQKAFEGSGKAYAPQVFAKVAGLLDWYSQAWVSQYTEACFATRLGGDQSEAVLDLRMQCLSNRLERFRSTVQVLSEASPALGDKAVNIAADLPAVNACGDVAMLIEEGPVAPSPVARARVNALSASLARANALLEAERNSEGAELIEKIVAAARAEGLKTVLAEALMLNVRSKNREGAVGDTEALSQEAILAAERTGQLKLVARVWVTRAMTVMQLGRFDEAHNAFTHAQAMLETLPSMNVDRGVAFYGSAVTYLSQKRPEEGFAEAQRAVAEFQKSSDGQRRLPEAMRMMASAANERGDHTEALSRVREARVLQTALFGEDHPALGRFFDLEGVILNALDRPDESDEAFQRALLICEKWQGTGAPCAATILNNLAMTDMAQNRAAKALEHLTRALAIYLKRFGPEHPELGNVYAQIAMASVAVGKPNEGVAAAKQAMAIREKNFSPSSIPVAYGALDLGEVLLKIGRCDQAEPYLARSQKLLQQLKAPASDQGDVLKDLAQVAECLKKPGLAISRAREAGALFEPLTNRDVAKAELHLLLANALWATGVKSQAVSEAAAAKTAFETRKADKKVRELSAWLSQHEVAAALKKK